jgi:hypothetical protein
MTETEFLLKLHAIVRSGRWRPFVDTHFGTSWIRMRPALFGIPISFGRYCPLTAVARSLGHKPPDGFSNLNWEWAADALNMDHMTADRIVNAADRGAHEFRPRLLAAVCKDRR